MKSKIIIILAWVGLFTLSGCDDFLEQTNTTNPNADTFFDSDEAVRAATAPLYNVVWHNFNEKFYYSMGDGRSNNISAQWSNYIKDYTNFNETSQTEGLEDAWGSLYSVVAQSCNTINNIQEKSQSSVSEAAKLEGIAEARFMRGVAYWYIGSLWGDAILYERTSDLASNFVVPASRQIDVIEFAIRDLEYAAKYLPRTSTAAGRVNRYSAFGMLSRVYLSMAGLTESGAYQGAGTTIANPNRGSRNTYYLDLARKAAMKVINESSFSLMENYGDLYTYANNNCKEAMFQLQWLAGSNSTLPWGTTNPIQAFFGWSTMVSDATNWGNATYSSWDLVDTYDPKDVIRRHATICVYGDEYPELYKKGGGYIYGITEEGYTEKCNIKKYVIGTHDDNGVSYQQSSGLNTHMLRLAEVYLNLVEAILGNNPSTTDATARTYFNMVRSRAGMKEKAVGEAITYEEINYERRIELAMEGQYWYDLLRRGYYEQDKVVQYLNSQKRNAGYRYIEGTTPDGGVKMYEFRSEGTGIFPATARHLLLPISDTDKGKNKYLDTAKYPAEVYEFDPEDKISESDLYN